LWGCVGSAQFRWRRTPPGNPRSVRSSKTSRTKSKHSPCTKTGMFLPVDNSCIICRQKHEYINIYNCLSQFTRC
jgi:hypothetical protein